MPKVSTRQKLIADLEESLLLLSVFYTLHLQQEHDALDWSTMLSSSSGNTSSESASSTTSDSLTSSNRSLPFRDGRGSDFVLECIKQVYSVYAEVQRHRYLERELDGRQLHLSRESAFEHLLDMEERAFVFMFRMNRASFDKLYRMLRYDPVFLNDSNSPQVNPRYQIAMALSRFGHDGNGSAVQNQRVLFSTSEGWVEESTWRVMRAISNLEGRYLVWPDVQGRRRICEAIGREAPFSSCVGFVDGSIILLAIKPATEDFADFYTRRKRAYGWNVAVVCDHERKVRGIYTGWVAAAHDQRVYGSTDLAQNPGAYFSPGEYLLADSAYDPATHVVPAYKRGRGQARLRREEERFNLALSRMRVRIEHTFGLMKERFKSLEGLRVFIRTDTDESRSRVWVICIAILHNFLLEDDEDTFWEGQNMEALQAQWEEAADKGHEDRERWERANEGNALETDKGDQRTREYVRQFAESVNYGPAYVGGQEDIL